MALEVGFGDDGFALGKFAVHDPCHALYALAQNIASLMSEAISGMREAKGYVRIVGNAEDEYMRAKPPPNRLCRRRAGRLCTASGGSTPC